MQGVPFRAAYGKIGQLRSFVHCPLLCLTATAGKETRTQIMEALHMRHTKLVKISPDKPNYKFVVRKCPGEVEDELMWVLMEFKEIKSSFSRTIIYYWSLSSCVNYIHFSNKNWMVLSLVCTQCIFQIKISAFPGPYLTLKCPLCRSVLWIPQNFACSFWPVECKIFYSLCKCTTQNHLLWSWGILDTDLKSNKGTMISYLIIIK